MNTVQTSFITLPEVVDQFRAELANPRWAFGILRALDTAGAELATLWVWDVHAVMWESYYNARVGTFYPLRLVAFILTADKSPADWWQIATHSEMQVLAARFPPPAPGGD